MNTLLTFCKKHAYLITSIALNIVLCFCLMQNCQKQESTVIKEFIPVHDTITLTEERIEYKTKVKFVQTIDTFYFNDKDTIYIEVPIEYKEYNDTIKNDSAEAKIKINYHGAFAELDSVKLDYKYHKEIQTVIKPPKKYGIGFYFGPYVGYGWSINSPVYGQPSIGVAVGVGLTRNF